jgi:hypothetical protein
LDVKHCSSESLRKPIFYSVKDVVLTYKQIIAHWPKFPTKEAERCHPFFLSAKIRFKVSDPVWFSSVPVGRNHLASLTKKLCNSVASLKGKNITNKTGRNTGITRLDESLVPIEKAMEVTGHRDIKSFKKYNRSAPVVSDRAVQRSLAGDTLKYSDLVTEKRERLDLLKVLTISLKVLSMYLICSTC